MTLRSPYRLILLAVPLLFIACATGCTTSPTPSKQDKPSQLQPITATTLEGQPFAITSDTHKATALIFLLPDCPIANGYAPEITRLQKAYEPQSIRFAIVYSDRDITAKIAATHCTDFQHSSQALIDPDLSLAKATGAKVTPEAVLLSPKGAVLYRGRIDDRFPAYGKRRAKPTKTELRDALDALLAGRMIAVARTEAVGCFLDLP